MRKESIGELLGRLASRGVTIKTFDTHSVNFEIPDTLNQFFVSFGPGNFCSNKDREDHDLLSMFEITNAEVLLSRNGVTNANSNRGWLTVAEIEMWINNAS